MAYQNEITTMNKNQYQLIERLKALGFSYDEAQALRRIEMTLQRWAEYECGDSNDRFSRSIERDETTGKPFWCVQWHNENKTRKTPTADREAGALRRLKAIIETRNARFFTKNGKSFKDAVQAYHQGDPRGCALYIVPNSELKDGASLDSVYTRGVAVCV